MSLKLLSLSRMVDCSSVRSSLAVKLLDCADGLVALLAAMMDSGSRLVLNGWTVSRLLSDFLVVTAEGDSKKTSMFLFFDLLALVSEDLLASIFCDLLPVINQLVNVMGALALDPRTASIASQGPEAVSSCPMLVT
jgi:hypothetical protein